MSADTVFDSSFWAPMKVFQHPRGKKKRRHAEERSLSPGGEYPSTARPGVPAPSPRSGLQSIRAGLSSVSMPPLMIACSSTRGAPTVFKCVWHVFDATLDRPGTAMQTRLRPGAQACTVSTRSGAVCVRGFVFIEFQSQAEWQSGRVAERQRGREAVSCTEIRRFQHRTQTTSVPQD